MPGVFVGRARYLDRMSQWSVTVLGCGLVGRAIAEDLAAHPDLSVTACDLSREALGRIGNAEVRSVVADLTDPAELAPAVEDADLVVGAVPGRLGYAVLRNLLERGRNVVDISFFPESHEELAELAERSGSVAVFDCGVAPGLSNLILGSFLGAGKRVLSFSCYVGGLPEVRDGVFQYKAPFSPSDVIEEYTRPARIVTGGRTRTVQPLSGLETMEIPGVGLLEAVYTDGLRSLVGLDVPEMFEKTLRYPGHIERIKLLRDIGFLDRAPVRVGDVQVRPVELTSALLFPLWELRDEDVDLTVFRVEIQTDGSQAVECHRFDLVDRRDPNTGHSSMARTTGYTCNAVAGLILDGSWSRVGLSAPEDVGRNPDCFARVRAYLEDRGVHLKEQTHS